MIEMSTAGDRVRESSGRTVLSATAWTFVLLGTLLPQILAEHALGTEPGWLTPAQVVVLVGFVLLTAVERFRPLRAFALALLAARGFFQVNVSWFEVVGVSVPSGIWFHVASTLLQSLFAVGLLLTLLATGATRGRLFLRFGRTSALVDREWVPGFRRERPWWTVGLVWGGVPGLVLLGSYLAAGRISLGAHDPAALAALVPLVLFAAALNAFNEEFIFRAGPLADLVDALGKRQTLLLLGTFFGLFHYYGSPGGIPGVVLTFVYGWLLSKSIAETRGLAVAWTIHFVADVLVFLPWYL